MYFRKLVTMLGLSLLALNVSAALEATSALPIAGAAPYFRNVINDKSINCRVDRPLVIPHPGDYIQVGDLIHCAIIYFDKDQDNILKPFYGIFGRKDTKNIDADTYFLFTDSNNNKTKVPRTDIEETEVYDTIIGDEEPELKDQRMAIYSIGYRITESAIGGKLGINTAPISQYGFPRVGEIISTDDIFNLSDITIANDIAKPWPIQPNTKVKVGIWNLKDVQAIGGGGYLPNAGTFPYAHPNSPEPKLNETYVAVVWYDANDNGLYDNDDDADTILVTPERLKLGYTKFKYQWYLEGNNSAAHGSVTGNKEIPFTGATQDNIILPATNAGAISQWPNLVSAGLPANEAGLQGFNLKVIVDME